MLRSISDLLVPGSKTSFCESRQRVPIYYRQANYNARIERIQCIISCQWFLYRDTGQCISQGRYGFLDLLVGSRCQDRGIVLALPEE
jgi:hypothetical protein